MVSSNRRAQAERNRAAVLDACRELLFRDGPGATTVRAVAEHAGLSPETVYKTFGSKAHLLKALWDSTLAGDDEPLTMAERPELRAVFATTDPYRKLNGYAAFVHGVHQRTGALFALLTQAGPEVTALLAATEAERLTGVGAFVDHLVATGATAPGLDTDLAADACWVLTSPGNHQLLTSDRGWSGARYQDWLAGVLTHTLLP